jgi:amino acid adenylation domain-containing protein
MNTDNANVNQSSFKSVDFDPFSDGDLLLTAPSTESQKEIWLSVQIGGDDANCAYNESVILTIEGIIDVDLMKQALKDLVSRHDALRTTLSPDGSTLCIAAGSNYDFPFIDLSEYTDSERQSRLDQILNQEVTRPFDLEHGPLFQAKIIKTGAAEYKLIITGHHIILDGWSSAGVIQDLNEIYTCHIEKKAVALAPANQFSRYALSLTEKEHVEKIEAQENFWIEQFKDNVPVLDLPTSFKRPLQRTFRAESKIFVIENDLISNLKKLGAKAKCSLTVALLAGFNILLYRLTAQNDIVVGVPAADQAATGLHDLVGHCVNTLPLKSHVDGGTTIIEYLKQLQSNMLSAYEHQRFTFGSLLQKLNVPRDLSRVPLVSILFNIDPGLKNLTIGGLKAAVKTNLRKFENFDIFLNGTELGGRVTFECLYNAGIFDHQTMDWRMNEYKFILANMVANPEAVIEDIDILPRDEYDLQVSDWNSTDMEYPREACLHDLFRAAADKFAKAIAVEFEDQKISYAELNQRSELLGMQLKTMGVRPGQLVGVFMERCIGMVVALLAILKAGGAYVPLDPEYPQERINYMIDNAEIAVLITQSHLGTEFTADSVQKFFMDGWEPKHAPGEDKVPHDWQPPEPENLAYVIFTSGSTGKPKGVKVPHRALVNFLTTMGETPGIESSDVLTAVTTLSFDIAGLELFLPLINGAKLHLVSRDTAADGLALIRSIEKCGATMMQATPGTWRIMLDAEWKGKPDLKILCGGEAFPQDLVKELISRSKEVWNMYGPTETTIWSTCCRLADPQGQVLIGKPIGNTQVYILDKRLRPVPVGGPGELYIGGDGVTHGYLKRPDLTSKAFMPNPFKPDARHAMMYKTGDLCRFLTDGNIEYFNRLDNQVKLRGFRIELGEIETHLGQNPAVKRAVAIVKEVAPGDTRLAAYVVPAEPGNMDETELRNHLQKSLPAYMIPQHFIRIDDVPLTPAGKIDRKKLFNEFDSGKDAAAENYIEPSTAMEKNVAAIWQEVLQSGLISKNANFFNIGGHSLLATRVVTRINREIGVEIKLGELFQHPTIEGLAVEIDRQVKAIHSNFAADEARETMEF